MFSCLFVTVSISRAFCLFWNRMTNSVDSMQPILFSVLCYGLPDLVPTILFTFSAFQKWREIAKRYAKHMGREDSEGLLDGE